MPGGEGRVRCPRARPHQLGSRAVRASCLPALRPACGVRRWKWVDRRRSDPRPLDGLPTKPGPDRTKGPHTPWAEPRWNAGRRARPIAEGRRKPPSPWRVPHAVCVWVVLACVCRRSISLYLPEASRKELLRNSSRSGPLWIGKLANPRHQKGGGKQNTLFDITRARGRVARTGSYCIRPRDPPSLALRATAGLSPPKRGARRRKRGRGTIRSSRSERRMVEGASDLELRCRRKRIDAARAPPTAQEHGPPAPLSRGGMITRPTPAKSRRCVRRAAARGGPTPSARRRARSGCGCRESCRLWRRGCRAQAACRGGSPADRQRPG
jgi:hypothetical protein